jgi:hypothetical protein
MDRSKCERRITQKASRGDRCSLVLVVSTHIPVEVRGECQPRGPWRIALGYNDSRPSCNQDDACIDRNPTWSPEHKRIAALMPIETAEAQKAQSDVIFLMNFWPE